MHSSHVFRAAALAVVFLVVPSACGGTTDEPADLSDPGFLPTGTYALHVVDASCNVNGAFQDGGRTALFRSGPGRSPSVNVPLPTKLRSAGESVFGVPRQDVDLTSRHVEGDLEDDPRCGTVAMSLDVTELTATRLAITYNEAPAACDLPACSVTYAYELVEAACPRECHARSATLDATAEGSMTWRCACE
jgi:hypothetical protein